MFNQSMDENSIYYTSEELEKIDGNVYGRLAVSDKASANYGKCYGYFEKDHPENITYKT